MRLREVILDHADPKYVSVSAYGRLKMKCLRGEIVGTAVWFPLMGSVRLQEVSGSGGSTVQRNAKIMASLRCHGDSDCNKTQITRNFRLYIIQLW